MNAPTLRQVIWSSYGWANGDVEPKVILPLEHAPRSDESQGDRLIAFLLDELQGDTTTGEREDWATAQRRAETILREVQSVVAALYEYEPEN